MWTCMVGGNEFDGLPLSVFARSLVHNSFICCESPVYIATAIHIKSLCSEYAETIYGFCMAFALEINHSNKFVSLNEKEWARFGSNISAKKCYLELRYCAGSKLLFSSYGSTSSIVMT